MIVGKLTTEHLGAQVRLEYSGWEHTGVLEDISHEFHFLDRDRKRTSVRIRKESGSTWYGTLTSDHPIELQEGA